MMQSSWPSRYQHSLSNESQKVTDGVTTDPITQILMEVLMGAANETHEPTLSAASVGFMIMSRRMVHVV